MTTAQLLIYLPWLLGAVVLVAAVSAIVLLMREAAALRLVGAREREQHEAIRTANVSLQERLAAAAEETARLRQEAQARVTELQQRIDGIAGELASVREKRTALEASGAAQAAQLERIPELNRELEAATRRAEALHQQNSKLAADYAALETRAEQQQRSAAEKIALLEQAETRLTKEFENLANRIFDDKQRKFSETSRQGVTALLDPVRQQLSDFRKKVEDIYDNENRDRASLRAEILQLKSLNERISGDALNLTNALKGDSKVRGNWGEIQLERLLEQSGLMRGREYEVQGSFRSADGQRFQPDVVVHLPEQKDVIIDSKVSLVAYEQYHASSEDDDRIRYTNQHVASLRNHINELSGKDYDELLGINSLDLVIMFVPIEPALLLALEHQPALLDEAFRKRILLVSPTTLMGTLQIIHNIWRYEQQTRNTLEIAEQGGRMYDAFVNFVESLEKVGGALDKAQAEYQLAHKRLTSGKGNLVGRTEKLHQLGVKAKKTLPAALLEEAGVEALPSSAGETFDADNQTE